MNIGNKGHLGYCTNIHAGETWVAVFDSLKQYCLAIKKELVPGKPFGIGLRLSNLSSIELLQGDNLPVFKTWLHENSLYVYTMNGFPYGDFHHQVVKDNVHTPDWTTNERVDYTNRLFGILANLLQDDMEGGISTSPLSYKYWHTSPEKLLEVKKKATENLIKVVESLVLTYQSTGKKMHLDIEPEPDGMLETSDEYIAFFENDLLVDGAAILSASLLCSLGEAQQHIRYHIQLCYDVCHFAVGYENATEVIQKMEDHNLLIGKIQISAALSCKAANGIAIEEQQACLSLFNEPTYLHQAVVKLKDDTLLKFRDLQKGIGTMHHPDFEELRAHFHVPVFIEEYMVLTSTQSDIVEALHCWCKKPYTQHLEVETYTWEVLPSTLQTELTTSIVREIEWVKDIITQKKQELVY